MYILGILGILQVFFMPGIVLLRRNNHPTRPVAYTMGVISTSLVFNYCLVFLATALHMYSRVLLSLVIACEFGLIIWQYRKALNIPIDHWLEKIRKAGAAALNKWAGFFQSTSETSSLYFLIKILYVCLCYLEPLGNRLGEQFATQKHMALPTITADELVNYLCFDGRHIDTILCKGDNAIIHLFYSPNDR